MEHKWKQKSVIEYLELLERVNKKLTMKIIELEPNYKPQIEELEEGLVKKELAKIALK